MFQNVCEKLQIGKKEFRKTSILGRVVGQIDFLAIGSIFSANTI